MHIQKRKLAKGVRYYLRYWKDNKNCCVPKKVIEDDPSFIGEYPFRTRAEAQKFIKLSNRLKDYKNHAQGLRTLKEKNRLSDFDEYRVQFFKDVKTKAPNSFDAVMGYYNNYVEMYFLHIKKEYNIAKWYLLFRDFRYWLRDEATSSRNDMPISYSTKNHCIGALNSFLFSMQQMNIIPYSSKAKCRLFPRHLVDQNARTVKDIISPNEYEKIRSRIKNSSHANLFDFVTILYNTGLRFSEAYSLSMADVYFKEDIKDGIAAWMKTAFNEKGLDIHGYIVITSQIKGKVRNRNAKTGFVDRKPLKGRKTKTMKDGRIIPITCLETMNILIERWNLALESWNRKEMISDRELDYFLFEDKCRNDLYRNFGKVSSKGFHACRHSYTTNLVGLTRNIVLTRTVLGHRALDVFERYCHIYEEMVIKGSQEKRVRKKSRKVIDINTRKPKKRNLEVVKTEKKTG